LVLHTSPSSFFLHFLQLLLLSLFFWFYSSRKSKSSSSSSSLTLGWYPNSSCPPLFRSVLKPATKALTNHSLELTLSPQKVWVSASVSPFTFLVLGSRRTAENFLFFSLLFLFFYRNLSLKSSLLSLGL
jgi:hypothetical protein